MADLISSDVTVTVDLSNRKRDGKRKKHIGTIVFGDNFTTMPPEGIPLPAIGEFGFIRQLDSLEVFPTEGTSAELYQYQATTHKLVPLEVSVDADTEAKVSQLSTLPGMPQGLDEQEVVRRTTLNFVATGW